MIARTVFVRLFVLLLLVPLCSVGMTPRVDMLRMSLSEAEQRFLDSNLQLLAGRCAIDAARAGVLPRIREVIKQGMITPSSSATGPKSALLLRRMSRVITTL